MAKICRTSDGDLLDTLCYQIYDRLNGTVEAVLNANPGLADQMQPLPAGLHIVMPDLPAATTEEVQLWA